MIIIDEKRIFEIISQKNPVTVALNAPDGMLPQVQETAVNITKKFNIPAFVLADTTWGTCDLNSNGAKVLGAEILFNIGHTNKLETFPGNLSRSAIELAKDWRTDKYLRNLEAMLVVTDGKDLFIISGSGDVLEPEGNIAAVGSGGNYALAAAKAIYENDISSEEICKKALEIAADICVYTNHNIVIETIKKKK